MLSIVNSNEMKELDGYTINNIGIPSLVLMERAALAVVDTLFEKKLNLKKTLVICGVGNNGGDGIAIGRILLTKGYNCDILIIGDMDKCTPETRQQLTILNNLGYELLDHIDNTEYTTIIDSLFGIGLTRNIENEYYDIINFANNCLDAQKIAVDISSGVNATTGQIHGIAFKADYTVTFAYVKTGMLLFPGCEYQGEIIIKDIGIGDFAFKNFKPSFHAIEENDIKNLLPARKKYSNKGTYGKILVIAGNKNMCGASYFSAKAALKTGAGMVKIFTKSENRNILQTSLPEAMLTTYNDYDSIEKICDYLFNDINWADSIVIGPGLGTDNQAKEIVYNTLKITENKPIVVDADAINIIASNKDLFKDIYCQNVIFTPQLGEMSRLIEKSTLDIRNDLSGTAISFSKKHNCICVLKDSTTLISNGIDTFINLNGNNGMATAGMGDTLTGIIAALNAVIDNYYISAALGTFIHGMAGDYIASLKGTRALITGEMSDGIEHVIKDIR